jgi:membrane protease YdiL (CAAX protease family)
MAAGVPDPSAEPVAPPHRPTALGFVVALVVLQALGGTAAQRASPVLGLAWSEACGFLLPALAAASGANLRPARFLLLGRRPTLAQLVLGAGAGVAGFAAAGALVALWARLLPSRWVQAFDLAPLFDLPPAELGGLAAVTCALAPLAEEAAFRGYLLSALRLSVSPARAILATTAVFAALHLDPVRLPGLLALGALFGWLAWRSGSLWPAVAAHAANNSVATLLAIAGAGRPDEAPEAAAGALLLLAAGSVGLGIVLPAFRRVAPDPPAAADAAQAADPAAPAGRFSTARLPAWQGAWAVAGLLALAALAVRASLRG